MLWLVIVASLGAPEAPDPWTSSAAPVLVESAAAPAEPDLPAPASYLATVAEGFYWAYAATLSNAKGDNCSFAPSCSRYGREAIQSYGLVLGLTLFAGRLMRSHIDLSGFYLITPQSRLADPLELNAWSADPPELTWHRALAPSHSLR